MTNSPPDPIVLASTGASGQVYARSLLELLLDASCRVDMVTSRHATIVCNDELGYPTPAHGLPDDTLEVHDDDCLDSALASGSYRTAAMVICPCSLNTLGAVAGGMSDTLIKRSAQVHLKQRRPLILAVREMPLSLIDLENMARLATAGAIIAPLCPAFYRHPQDIGELVRFTTQRLLDLVGIATDDYHYKGRDQVRRAGPPMRRA